MGLSRLWIRSIGAAGLALSLGHAGAQSATTASPSQERLATGGLISGHNGQADEVMVFVMDPVAHTLTTWLSGAPNQPKVASVFKITASDNRGANTPTLRPDSSAASRPQPIITTEDLGTEEIQGLETSSKRTTTIVPVGRSGNSAPITKTHEVWTSADLHS